MNIFQKIIWANKLLKCIESAEQYVELKHKYPSIPQETLDKYDINETSEDIVNRWKAISVVGGYTFDEQKYVELARELRG